MGLKKKVTDDLQDAAREWIELKAEKIRIENRIEELKKTLEPYLESQPDYNALLNGWKFSLLHSERETFKLSDAKAKIDGRVLSPYITKSQFTQIRTTWKGGKEEEAA